jgi:hypothetical protein
MFAGSDAPQSCLGSHLPCSLFKNLKLAHIQTKKKAGGFFYLLMYFLSISTIAVFAWVQYTFDLSPNLSPTSL